MRHLALAKTRPYAYHLTARAHLELLRKSHRLDSTEKICIAANRASLLKERRLVAELVHLEGSSILIRDQQPLQEGRMDLGGRPFIDLLTEINRRVFFWAGRDDGPGDHGESHFERYANESPIVLKVPMADLLAEGAAELCRYNSGSPRHSPQKGKGRPSPRGADTFVPISEWQHRPSEVVEVTFVGSVGLPASTLWGNSPAGPWCPFAGNLPDCPADVGLPEPLVSAPLKA